MPEQEAAHTDDALVGDWRILQPRDGHRWSTDDLLCAWFALETLDRLGMRPDRALDLGTGLGSVAMMLAWALPDLHVTGIEKQAHRLALARQSAARNGIRDRSLLLAGDIRDTARILHEAGAPRDGWPLVTATPPYWPVASGTHRDDDKARCRFDLIGSLESYAAVVPELLGPRGLLVMVYDGRQMDRLEQATRALAPVRLLPVHAREGDPPLLVLGAWSRNAEPSEAGHDLSEDPLTLRLRDGSRSEAFRAIRIRMGMPT
ncbi:MAG: methyltransferase [Candidatus Sericytochromatia bacterium]|nr:methyltransferase [Candidatus Sericytochromatia bacterium]